MILLLHLLEAQVNQVKFNMKDNKHSTNPVFNTF